MTPRPVCSRKIGALAQLAALLCLCAACTGDRPPFRAGMPPLRTDSTTCQFGERGVRVSVDDAPDGVDVVLTTIRDVDDLRHRAHDAAAMYGAGAHRGLGHNGKHGNGAHHGLGLARLSIPVKAEEVDVWSGAKIHVSPVDPAKVDVVRSEVRARADDAQWGECP